MKSKFFSFSAFLAIFVLAFALVPSAFAGVTCGTGNYGAVGLAFDSGPMTVSGGTAPYTYSVVGTLPAGLMLNTSTGEVTGTPTATGSFSIQVTDSMGDVETTTCTFAIASLTGGIHALGLTNAYSLISLTGSISDSADITGRIAAAGPISQATTIGTALRTSDPYLSLASANGGPYAMVAAGGIPTSNSFNVNAGGNVYSSTSTNAGFNFANENYLGSPYAGSTLVTDGISPINFSTLESTMNTLSAQLAGLNAYGVVCSVNNSGSIVAAGGCPTNPIYFNQNSQHYNPSWLVLYGTSASVNVFNITPAQLQSPNYNLDIEVPTGSTVIVNVVGSSPTLQNDLYFQGNTVTDANAGTILFNFPSAAWVTIDGQFDGVLLAPYASLSGKSQMGGVFIASSIGSTGEVHYDPFSGSLPWSNTSTSLFITCAAVNTGTVGVAFDSGSMTVTGGTTPYTYSIVGRLPAGLTLNPLTGEITGIPTTAGTFQVRVTDANGVTGTACAIAINSPLSVCCAAVTMGEAGVSFDSGPITVTGGSSPYSYSIVGTLPAGLTLNTSTGEITGTPTAAGTFSVKVTDSDGNSNTSCNITINGPLSVTCAAVNTGEVGVAFNSGPMTVSGGVAPYAYSIVGTLPAGLTLNTSTGAITGTPTASGNFSVKVTDAGGNSSISCNITINGPLSVTCAAINTGEVGVDFNSGPMTVTGGVAPHTYSIVGTLPAGLTLNTSTGAITGTPTAAGTFSVKVTDADGNSSTSCNITVIGPLSVICAAINTGEVGVGFNSGPMTVTGGVAPYTYSIVGTLPAGLTLNTSTGAITGTPTAAGTFSVKVTDADGNSSTSCNITISGPFSVTCAAVTTGEVGAGFNSGPMTVTGGMAPYTYSIVGTLPSGLLLNTSTGAITGTPTASGTFQVKVTDAKGAIGTACAITVNAGLSVTCAAVTTGEVGVGFNSGAMTVTGGTAPYTFSIVGTLPPDLTLNTSTGAITGTPTASGTAPYVLSITGTLPAGLTLNPSTGAITGTPTASGSFSVKVTDANGATGTACAITISAGVPIGPDDTATIGFWDNKNGHALIDSMNGGSTATNLANWLATNFPYLYGANSSNNLTGETNADVAALFDTFFGGTAPKTNAQVMGGALATYVTDSNLAGSDVAASYSFNFSTTGTGAKTYNVGSDGTAIGLINNTFYTDLQLLQLANLETQLGTFDSTAFNDVFSNINQIGDIGGSAGTVNPMLSLSCPAVTSGPVGVAFNSGPMTASGGTAPYTYSVIGTVPAGLTLNTSTGTVTGTPTASGSFSVQVTDSLGDTGTTTCTFNFGAGYTLTVNPSSITGVAGQSATTTFTFTPVGGYVGTVTFSCSGLPAGATCTFVPPSVTANGSNTVQTSTLTITTTASGTATIAENRTTPGHTLASFFLLPGLMLGGFIAWRRRSFTVRMRSLLLMLLVGATLVGGAIGCGGGSIIQTVTPLGSHVITVVANANVSTDSASGSSITQNATFTLTVIQ